MAAITNPARCDIARRSRWPVLVAGLALVAAGCGKSASTADLIAQAHSKDSADRVKAIHALSRHGAEADRIVPVLVELLKDEDAFVRRDAARAIGRMGQTARSAEPALLLATRDRNAHVRQAAADAVQKVRSG